MDHNGGGHLTRCVKHPSQFFTGFCSSCLAERLSGIDSNQDRKKGRLLFATQTEIVEIVESQNGQERKLNKFRRRKTLESLFNLDKDGAAQNPIEGDHESLMGDGFLNDGSKAKNTDSLDDGDGNLFHQRLKGVASWFSSIFSNRVFGWGLGASSKLDVLDEIKPSFRHSCNCMATHDSIEGVWEVPRHSWDGSMMGRAFSCPFSCLAESRDGANGTNSRVPEEAAMAETLPREGTSEMNNNNNPASCKESHSSSNRSLESHLSDNHSEEGGRGLHSSKTVKKKSQRWSKVWDRSITSPFRDFVKKREHVLERSLSESWQDTRKSKNLVASESETLKMPRLSSIRANYSKRSSNVVNGGLHDLRSDWQNRKLGRSRSVHYSSPGNIDNGLLRFYLTPLRSSRRSSARRGRVKPSHSFIKEILGW